jgi:hypothetical protein
MSRTSARPPGSSRTNSISAGSNITRLARFSEGQRSNPEARRDPRRRDAVTAGKSRRLDLRWTNFQRVWPPGDNYDPDLDLCLKYARGFGCRKAIAQRRLPTEVDHRNTGLSNEETLSGREHGRRVGSNHAGPIRCDGPRACRTGCAGCFVGSYRPGAGWSRSWGRGRLHSRTSHREFVGAEAIWEEI